MRRTVISTSNVVMPRTRPQFLVREVSRHGKPVWYCRRGGRRIRLNATYGTPEFEAEFAAALKAISSTKATVETKSGSLAWLIARYRETDAWQKHSAATKRQRENIFRQVCAAAGDVPAAAITRRKIQEGRDERAKRTPHQARHFLDALRGLFRWAYGAQLVKIDPTHGVENPSRRKTQGFLPWDEDDVAAYERRWPIGTPQRVWLDVLLYTGLRRGDAARLGRQHVRQGGVVSLVTEKTDTTVTLPILPVLQRTLDAGPRSDLTFIVGVKGRPFGKESFGNAFAEAARAAGVRKSCHGLRKIAAMRCALNGATVPQMNAIFGWTGSAMAMHYIEAADRVRLAAEAIDKLNDKRTSNVAPFEGGASHLEKS